MRGHDTEGSRGGSSAVDGPLKKSQCGMSHTVFPAQFRSGMCVMCF